MRRRLIHLLVLALILFLTVPCFAADKYVELKNLRMHYTQTGDASGTIVLVPGYTAPAGLFDGTIDQLAARHTVYALDMRGTGQSGDAAVETLRDYSEDIYEFATTLGLKKFALMGWSMAGGTVLQFALDHPDMAAAIVMISPIHGNGIHVPDLEAAKKARVQLFEQHDSEKMRARIRNLIVHGSGPAGYIDWAAEEVLKTRISHVTSSLDAMQRFNVMDRLSALTVPTLIVHGDTDRIVDIRGVLDTWKAMPPVAHLQVLYHTGHFPFIERPSEFVAIVEEFIGDVEAGTPK